MPLKQHMLHLPSTEDNSAEKYLGRDRWIQKALRVPSQFQEVCKGLSLWLSFQELAFVFILGDLLLCGPGNVTQSNWRVILLILQW